MKGHPWCHTALCDYLQPIWSFLMFWVINSSPQLSGVDMSIIPICRCVCGSFSLVSLPAIYLRGANTWRTFFLPSTSFSSDNELQGIASNSWEWLSGAFTYYFVGWDWNGASLYGGLRFLTEVLLHTGLSPFVRHSFPRPCLLQYYRVTVASSFTAGHAEFCP